MGKVKGRTLVGTVGRKPGSRKRPVCPVCGAKGLRSLGKHIRKMHPGAPVSADPYQDRLKRALDANSGPVGTGQGNPKVPPDDGGNPDADDPDLDAIS